MNTGPDTWVAIITAVTALVTATVALVKAIRGDGRKDTPDPTPADSTTDQ